MKSTVEDSHDGEVVVSEEAWSLIKDRAQAKLIKRTRSRADLTNLQNTTDSKKFQRKLFYISVCSADRKQLFDKKSN